MIYPNESVKEWAERYKIPTHPSNCEKCGELQNFVKPFAHLDFRGLISDHEKCGKKYRQSRMVSVDEDWNNSLRKLGADLEANGPMTNFSKEDLDS